MQLRSIFLLFLLLAAFVLSPAIFAEKSQAAATNLKSLGVNLVGVVAFEQKPKAMISMAGVEEDMLIGEGDLIEGYTVRRIEKDRVELARNGQVENLQLKSADPVKAVEPAKKIYADADENKFSSSGEIKRLVSSRSLKRVLSTAKPKVTTVAFSSGRPRFIRPVNSGYVSSPFGYRVHPTTNYGVGGTYAMHRGTDIAAPPGTPVLAASSGVVKESAWTWAKGNYIEVQHSGGYSTAYFHMTRRVVQNGASVSAGQVIGYVGSTGISSGPHLHFEIHINGTPVNPANYVLALNSR